ncbi:DUF5063 domain-containing protein [Luteipulveratus sp. YIM 133132]|uniref:DUF5063 domain-containing protein n=1 Tax=Luteipulveratus flavus TaxID=3031728 RepID=A0ABT6CE41_9MICO|nr:MULTISPECIES: DUF5063 domain-containing protein [unclassified Luteipulveratus]MDE9365658.1 DUF5063 domain-containing protein [Luteipulveratus sp. YIM 133132]MDF8266304.1 DUF5063 domain-containing protein [Luteipulveratus sp. YIM 133296]
MPDITTPTEPGPPEHADLAGLAQDTARDVRDFSTAVRDIAAGVAPDAAIPLLLLVISQLQVTGARLGAIQDVLPDERFEPDSGPEIDHDALRTSLANLLEGLDDYADVVDPLTSVELGRGALSDDLAGIVAALEHGLAHYDQDRVVEAMWWWQFSYLSEWGVRASAALRVVLTILGHLRLDADEETVADAEFDALHP